jgi:hypothetical protein
MSERGEADTGVTKLGLCDRTHPGIVLQIGLSVRMTHRTARSYLHAPREYCAPMSLTNPSAWPNSRDSSRPTGLIHLGPEWRPSCTSFPA